MKMPTSAFQFVYIRSEYVILLPASYKLPSASLVRPTRPVASFGSRSLLDPILKPFVQNANHASYLRCESCICTFQWPSVVQQGSDCLSEVSTFSADVVVHTLFKVVHLRDRFVAKFVLFVLVINQELNGGTGLPEGNISVWLVWSQSFSEMITTFVRLGVRTGWYIVLSTAYQQVVWRYMRFHHIVMAQTAVIRHSIGLNELECCRIVAQLPRKSIGRSSKVIGKRPE